MIGSSWCCNLSGNVCRASAPKKLFQGVASVPFIRSFSREYTTHFLTMALEMPRQKSLRERWQDRAPRVLKHCKSGLKPTERKREIWLCGFCLSAESTLPAASL